MPKYEVTLRQKMTSAGAFKVVIDAPTAEHAKKQALSGHADKVVGSIRQI